MEEYTGVVEAHKLISEYLHIAKEDELQCSHLEDLHKKIVKNKAANEFFKKEKHVSNYKKYVKRNSIVGAISRVSFVLGFVFLFPSNIDKVKLPMTIAMLFSFGIAIISAFVEIFTQTQYEITKSLVKEADECTTATTLLLQLESYLYTFIDYKVYKNRYSQICKVKDYLSSQDRKPYEALQEAFAKCGLDFDGFFDKRYYKDMQDKKEE